MRKDRIEKGGIADRTDDQLVDLLWRSRTNKDNIDHQKDKKKDGRNEKKGFDLQNRIPFKKRFFEMVAISFGVAALAFIIGFFVRMFLKVDV